MTGAEFISTSPVPLRSADDDINGDGGVDEERGGGDETETHATRTLLRLSIRFDPYSLTAEDDYENLKSQIRSFRIVELLRNELAKSRIHAALSRKLISAIRYLETAEKSVAARALVDNLELLYPILSSVLVSLAAIYDDINEPTKRIVNDRIREAVVGRSYLMRVDSNLAFAIRLLSKERSPVGEEVLARLYRSRTSPMVRRDIILVMARWRAWYWLSDIRNEFRVMGSHERRAFLVASFVMGDEGRHWRRSMKDHFSPFEREVRDWAISKIRGDRNWGIPI
ncbi:MAG: hypothetical protein O2995_03170 [Proteobacteria bacterium]|nr:hypothetical protein [Pseudomonadota bacterium]